VVHQSMPPAPFVNNDVWQSWFHIGQTLRSQGSGGRIHLLMTLTSHPIQHQRRDYSRSNTSVYQPWRFSRYQPNARDVHSRNLTLCYEELKHLSSNGQYVDTTAAVATLVRERGEKLNIRIYDALILANADAFHGSAAEVRGLLQEMIDEGVTPDAATYHKILKVLLELEIQVYR